MAINLNPIAVILGAVGGAVETVLGMDDIPVPNSQAPVIARQVQERVEAVVRREVAPQIEHLTNSEPWYRSRVTWGVIVSMGSSALGIAGLSVDSADSAMLVEMGMAAGAFIGGAITIYGRWRARKPIGR